MTYKDLAVVVFETPRNDSPRRLCTRNNHSYLSALEHHDMSHLFNLICISDQLTTVDEPLIKLTKLFTGLVNLITDDHCISIKANTGPHPRDVQQRRRRRNCC